MVYFPGAKKNTMSFKLVASGNPHTNYWTSNKILVFVFAYLNIVFISLNGIC